MRPNYSKDCHPAFISRNIELCFFIIVTEKIKTCGYLILRNEPYSKLRTSFHPLYKVSGFLYAVFNYLRSFLDMTKLTFFLSHRLTFLTSIF